MDSIWNTIATILATGAIMVLVYWAQHHWTGKRELRDARRRYRESMVAPIRAELNKLHTILGWREVVNIIASRVKGQSVNPRAEEDVKILEEIQQGREARNLRKVHTDFLPLVAVITNKAARKVIGEAFLYASLNEETLRSLNKVEEDVESQIRLAYQKLEDFVCLAD